MDTHPAGVAVLSVGQLIAVCKGQSRRFLADARRPVKKIGVRDPLIRHRLFRRQSDSHVPTFPKGHPSPLQ
jgi:hypothetical protein